MRTILMQQILTLLLLVSLVGCFSETVNRNPLSLSGKNPISNSGIDLSAACACKYGHVMDGSELACADLCRSSSNLEVTSYLILSLGRDVTEPIYKKNNGVYNPEKPFTSICGISGYKCRILNVEPIYKDAEEQLREVFVNIGASTTSKASIFGDNKNQTIIKLNGLVKPANALSVQIVFDDEPVFSSNEQILNVFRGDGLINPDNLNALNRYTCLYANEIAGVNNTVAYSQTLQTFHYAKTIPQYFFTNPVMVNGTYQRAAHPFLCHHNNNRGWNFLNSPVLPTLIHTIGGQTYNDIEVPGTILPRLNWALSSVQFWGPYGEDLDDFYKIVDSSDGNRYTYHGLMYNIDRRVYVDYLKNQSESGDWEEVPLFDELRISRKPNPTINGNVITTEMEHFGYFLQPQPTGFSASRSSFKCPSLQDLNDADTGRLASLKKVLSTSSGTLRYFTKPFFAACASGITLGSGNGNVSPRRVIYVSMEELIAKLGVSENQILSGQVEFNLNQIQTPVLLKPDGDPLRFKLVRPSVIDISAEEAASGNPITCDDTENNIDEGFIFGCFPVRIN